MAVDPALLDWWKTSLPKEKTTVWEAYIADHPEYKDGIPFPPSVSADTVKWYKPSRGKWVIFSNSKWALYTALRDGWLPEEPEGVVQPSTGTEEEETSDYQCDICDKVLPTSFGLRLHKVWHVKNITV